MKKLLLNFLVVLAGAVEAGNFDEKKLLHHFYVANTIKKDWVAELNILGGYAQIAVPTEEVVSFGNLPALYRTYTGLQTRLPYVALGNLPTPVHKLATLSALLDHSIYIKRDDLTGGTDERGIILYGGNKERKLRFLLAQAQAHHAKTVMTFGCAGSNHAVATASAASLLGLKCLCMLKPQKNSHVVRQNLLLHQLFKSELHYYQTNDLRYVGTLMTWLEQKNKDGRYPYVIPTGGSCPLGAVGFVDAVFELKDQIQSDQLPEPDYIYVPCGSCGTTAGLVLGCKLAGLKSHINAITVEPGNSFKQDILALAHATNVLLHECDAAIPLVELSEDDVSVNPEWAGNYGIFTQEGAEAQKLMAAVENINLEGTYTAKACAALLHDLKNNHDKNAVTLFWDTYCGLDFSAVLSNQNYHCFDPCFHYYFEQEVQSLDKH
jgi:1-aminocyclopropane-1-carboxylate deaminase/D-cysteine desulfhydrase-like pyridoxal-dependent ACC family enzyme